MLVLLVVLSLGFNTAHSQKELNDYKYIIVPNKYDFLNEEDKYQLNSLTKFLFNKYGFLSYLEDESFPEDLRNNYCLALRADVNKLKGLLNTKLDVALRDCNNRIVFKTDAGKSREKEFKKAYNLALRDAFKSFQKVNYNYNSSSKKIAQTESQKPKPETKSTPLESISPSPEKSLSKRELPPRDTPPKTVVPEVKSRDSKPNVQASVNMTKTTSDVLYAQATDGGFQLVDSTPKVVYKMVYSGLTDVFIVHGKDAIIHKVNDVWTISEVYGNTIQTKALNIKF